MDLVYLPRAAKAWQPRKAYVENADFDTSVDISFQTRDPVVPDPAVALRGLLAGDSNIAYRGGRHAVRPAARCRGGAGSVAISPDRQR